MLRAAPFEAVPDGIFAGLCYLAVLRQDSRTEQTMQACNELITSLRRRRVTLWTEGGQLHFSAPKGSLSADDLQNLRARKLELIELLEQAELSGTIAARPAEPARPQGLTALQMRKWRYIHERTGGRNHRTCLIAHRVQGPLNVDALTRSWQIVVRRHDALRTRFAVVEGNPMQWVDADLQHPLELVDLSTSATEGATDVAMRACALAVGERMSVRHDPMLIAKLYRSSPQRHVLLVAMNHMISDGVSCDILAEEVWGLYHRYLQGLPMTLPDPSAQFSQYVAWQHRTHRAWLRGHGPFWRERLRGISHSPLAAHDEVDPPLTALHPLAFDAGLSARLREIAQQKGSLTALVVLTLCIAALSRRLQRRDLVLACVSNGRDRPELQHMVGLVADYLHIRARIDTDDKFVTLLGRITTDFHGGYAHPDYGRVPDLIPECRPDFAFNWLPHKPASDFACAPSAGGQPIDIQPLRVPLALPMEPPMKLAPAFEETPAQISGALFYRPDVFTAQTIAELADEVQVLADRISRHPGDRIA